MIGLALVVAAEARPWVRDPGSFYAKLGVSRFEASDFSSLQVSGYADVGLPWKLALTASVPWVEGISEDAWLAYRNRDFGDGEFALTRAILWDGWALSATAGVRVPLYADRSEDRQATYGSLAGRFPTPGDGTVDLDARVEVGRGLALGKSGGWVEASARYRHRLSDPVDGLVGGIRAGIVPRSRGKDVGWVGVEAGGVARLEEDPATRTWLRLGAFGAARIYSGLAVEATAGWIPVADVASEGFDLGLGLSWTR